MKLKDILTENLDFKLQTRYKGGDWEDLADELYSKDEAQEFLNTYNDGDPQVEERAVSIDGTTVLRPAPTPSSSSGGNILSRNASPEVHQRNSDFFDKYL